MLENSFHISPRIEIDTFRIFFDTTPKSFLSIALYSRSKVRRLCDLRKLEEPLCPVGIRGNHVTSDASDWPRGDSKMKEGEGKDYPAGSGCKPEGSIRHDGKIRCSDQCMNQNQKMRAVCPVLINPPARIPIPPFRTGLGKPPGELLFTSSLVTRAFFQFPRTACLVPAKNFSCTGPLCRLSLRLE